MSKPRRFKLRNGIIVEECNDSFPSGHHNYKVINNMGITEFDYLSLIGNKEEDSVVALGGAFGPDFDIIEEVPIV